MYLLLGRLIEIEVFRVTEQEVQESVVAHSTHIRSTAGAECGFMMLLTSLTSSSWVGSPKHVNSVTVYSPLCHSFP